MGEEKAMESKPSDQQTAAKKDMKSKDSDIEYPSGLIFALLIVSIFAAMFLVSLVRSPSKFDPTQTDTIEKQEGS